MTDAVRREDALLDKIGDLARRRDQALTVLDAWIPEHEDDMAIAIMVAGILRG